MSWVKCNPNQIYLQLRNIFWGWGCLTARQLLRMLFQIVQMIMTVTWLVEDWSKLQWQMMCRCEGAGHEMTPDPISVLIMASCNIRPALCWYTCQSVEDDTRVNKDIAIAMELSEAHTIYEVIRYNVMLNGRKHTELHIIPNWTVRISEVAVLSDGMVQGRGCGSGGMVQSSVLSSSGHPAFPRPAPTHSSEGNYNCVLTWWLELANMWQRWPTLVSDNTSAVWIRRYESVFTLH